MKTSLRVRFAKRSLCARMIDLHESDSNDYPGATNFRNFVLPEWSVRKSTFDTMSRDVPRRGRRCCHSTDLYVSVTQF